MKLFHRYKLKPWRTLPVFASHASGLSTGLLVSDSFTDTDGTLLSAHPPDLAPLGSVWSSNTAAQITSNQVKAVAANYASASIVSGAYDVEITFTCTNTAGSSNVTMDSGMHLRIADGKYYRLGFNIWAKAIRIWEYDGSAWVSRASSVVTPNPVNTTPYTLVVTAQGSTISIAFESLATASYALATLNQTITRHGLYLYKADTDYGDNYTIEGL